MKELTPKIPDYQLGWAILAHKLLHDKQGEGEIRHLLEEILDNFSWSHKITCRFINVSFFQKETFSITFLYYGSNRTYLVFNQIMKTNKKKTTINKC